MRSVTRPFVLASLLLASATVGYAQRSFDMSGHWEGAVPGLARFEIDVVKDAKGELTGTFNMPDENLKGLSLLEITVEGPAVSFAARSDQRFNGSFSDDGKSMFGEYIIEGFTVPFNLTRTGNAKIERPPASAAIGKEFEGRWTNAVEAGGMPFRLVLTLANQPDGTATGRLVNLDQGGLTIPVSFVQHDSTLTLDIKAVGGAYSGTLNMDRTEIVGRYSQGEKGVPLTFRRSIEGRK